MAPLRIHAGLGDSPTVDWLRIVWPDAVLQAEMEMAANCVTAVEEVPRKASSCPYLFAWNGEQFEFVADFGGVGGLGYLVSPGQLCAAGPDRVPAASRSSCRATASTCCSALTPLEEVTYFDEAKLVAVDHPAGDRSVPERDDGDRRAAAGVRGVLLRSADRAGPGGGPSRPRRHRLGAAGRSPLRRRDAARSAIPGLGRRAFRRVGFRRSLWRACPRTPG